MDLTTALTGMLPLIVVVSAIFTAIGCEMLLALYRRAVVRSMSARAGAAPSPVRDNAPVTLTECAPLAISQVGADEPVSGAGLAAYQATVASLRRLGVVYTLAGLAYAVVLSLPWMLAAGGGFPLPRLLWLTVCYGWPTIVTLWLVATITARQRFILAGINFGLVAATGAIALGRNPDLSVGELIFFWFFANSAGTLLLAAFLTRRTRAVGPMVLAFMVSGVTGAFLTVTFAGSHEGLLRLVAEIGGAFGLGATTLFVLLQLLGFVLFGLLGWWLLGRLGRAYRAKRFSDQSLSVDALWLLFGVLQSFTLAFEGWAWIFTGLIAFGVYKVVTLLGFARVAAREDKGLAGHPSLLLLRVFALGRRSERLYDALSKRWLRAGSIGLIAGPDLVTSTLEPHEFLAFVGGRLSRQFIESDADLDRRLAEHDTQPDPDGRYRVNELFCRQDTWQMTMRRLAAHSDAVLMDLRSFSPRNQGCLWELEQLLIDVPLERVLLVTDETTDQPFLQNKLQETWGQVPAHSPNRSIRVPTVRIVGTSSSSARQAGDALVQRLLDACMPAAA